MKIAVIGTGIAGNVAAYHLAQEHEITVYEANNYVGGHTHTHNIDWQGQQLAIDTGFIVFNRETYPNFIKLLDELGVEFQPSIMSFSVKSERDGLEYNGSSLNQMFAQRRNLFRPSFYRMIRDILRFFRESRELLQKWDEDLTLGDYLIDQRYGQEFIDHFIIPMGAAIWSTEPARMLQFPACYFVRFFRNHGLLGVDEQLQWYVIKGGSKVYVEKLIAGHRDRIRTNARVLSVRRQLTHVEVTAADGTVERYDQVFIASHSDQALAMLQDPTSLEREVLGAIRYQKNEAVLHTDETLLPKSRRARASWNYHLLEDACQPPALTYNMNLLQGLPTRTQFLVTLNNSDAINPNKVLRRLVYDHPVYTTEAVAAQQRQWEINGINRTYYMGAYWRHGFHEDGVVSALNALEQFKERRYAQLSLRRAS
ncbi:MAG: NAD(P)/FAD-dependent oxidoreductase [Acidiferrobacterales bacterium]